MKLIIRTTVLICTVVLGANAQDLDEDISNIYDYSLKELADLKVITGSFQEQVMRESPSNIMILTRQMIDERGYQTLVDICQDVPGFDFMVYNGGSGEHSTYNMNRGIGSVGNPNILIMVDGIIQNNISFNWSLLWTYENTFADVERVEIVQGPGSVLYGAQAVTGIIHIITKKGFEGANIRTAVGSNFTRVNDINLGANFKHDISASLTIHTYETNGDQGKNRYDPGGYFKNNLYPAVLTQEYEGESTYLTNTTNTKGGRVIPNGFNTSNESFAMRLKLSKGSNELGLFLSEFDRGYGSSVVHYKYDLTSRHNRSRYRSYHAYFRNRTSLSDKLWLDSDVVLRSTNVLPETGLRYLYRFDGLTKGYSSESYQGYFEERLTAEVSKDTKLYLGLKGALSKKSESIISLGPASIDGNTTSSSWDLAEEGFGLNQPKEYPTFWVRELASYFLFDKSWTESLTSSAGIRYDYSSEFGSILNPRFSVNYISSDQLIGAKLMYGRAFRQPGIFELTSEFRGNSDLIPEKMETTELEINSHLNDGKVSLRATTYYSILHDFIDKVPDESKPAGERFENVSRIRFSGVTTQVAAQLTPNTIVNANYNFLMGIDSDGEFFDIERTARHKLNAGINQKFFERKLTMDLRANWVGRRKGQSTNEWLQTYEDGFAPSYLKLNTTVGYKLSDKFLLQAMIYNLTNTGYYGVGRETGSGFIEDYNYQSDVDPEGFIPSYHPQPGRTFLIRLTYRAL